ncbi:MAG: hypothetical protein ABIO45_09225 [Burkholderiaceae bacterium]
MKYARRWLAWISGVVLYGALIVASRFVAGSAVPAEFASFFADQGSDAGLIVEALVVAVFVFTFAVGWGYATLRPYNKGRRVFTLWCIAGLVCGFLIVFMISVSDSKEGVRPSAPSLLASLLSSNEPPLWGLLNLLAAPAGLLLAGALVRRAVPPVSRRRMLRPR